MAEISKPKAGGQLARIVVGVADLKCAAGPPGIIATHALGSCIGVTVWDPVIKAGGMLHYMLAQPADRGRAERSPFMYAVSGVPALFRQIYELGGDKSRLMVTVAGGAEIIDDKVGFSIGKRNHNILRKLFWKNGIAVQAEDVGGNHARHMMLDLETGKVTIRTGPKETILWQA